MHRNSAKSEEQKLYKEIKFLQVQNQRLRDELSDAKELIQMNKIEINVLSQNKSCDKKLIDVIYNYRQQIEALESKKQILYQNSKKLHSEKFVVEQLNQQLFQEQKSLQQLHKHRLQQLVDVIKILEEKISNCEKIHDNYSMVTGFVEKIKNVIDPSEQALMFKAKEDEWSYKISVLQDQLTEHKDNEQNLLLANGVLRNKVVSLQAKLAMPNKNLNEILDKSLKRLMLYFIETQKKMLTGDDSDSQQQDLQLIAPQLLQLFPHKDLRLSNDIKVPSLNFLGIRAQQIKGNQKIQEDLDRRKHLSLTDKLQRYKVQLEYTRRCLAKVTIQLKSQSDKRKILERICEQLESRNELLLKTSEVNKKKIQKIRKQKQNKDILQPINETKILDDETINHESNEEIKRHKENIKQSKNRQYEVNKFLENVQTPFQYKLHLKLLAKDLNKNHKLKNLDKNKKKIIQERKDSSNFSKLKRSTSNPFLYFNEKRENIVQANPDKQNNDLNDQTNQRFEQTEFLFLGNRQMPKFTEELDDLDNS